MKISHLDHVALVCRDAHVSKNWYIEVFEMEWIHREKWDGNPLFLRKGACYLALFQAGKNRPAAAPPVPRIDHFAFRAETQDDYESVKAQLRTKGIPFDEDDHEISASIYLKDPDGITVEVTTYDR